MAMMGFSKVLECRDYNWNAVQGIKENHNFLKPSAASVWKTN
jgi:hypothetical protein